MVKHSNCLSKFDHFVGLSLKGLTSGATTIRMWKVYKDVVLNFKNWAKSNQTDQTAGGLPKSLSSKQNIMPLVNL